MSRNKNSKALKSAVTAALKYFDKVTHPTEAQAVTAIRGVAKDYGVDPSDLYGEVRHFIFMSEED